MDSEIDYSSSLRCIDNHNTNQQNKCLFSIKEPPYIPPSKLLLDKIPSAPSADDPHQRIIGRIDRPALKIYLRILAGSEGIDASSAGHEQSIGSVTPPIVTETKHSSKRKSRKLGDKVPKISKKHNIEDEIISQPSENDSSDDALFYKVLSSGICDGTLLDLAEHRLNLADYRPLNAPFVPEILKLLVNSIERDCHDGSWELIFTSFSSLKNNAEKQACLLLQNWTHQNHLRRQIRTLSPPMKIATLRMLLSGFKQKPLHFNRRLLMNIIERPLFDQFLRPNPKIKTLVRHTALPCNRTSMDTLAFLMLHCLHAWEFASNPMTAKLRLAKLYGPLIISFAERPVVLDQDPTDYKSEEAAILEVVLEVCNRQFWDNLSMLQLRNAFYVPTRFEKSQIVTKEPEIIDSEYEYEEWFSYLFPKASNVYEILTEKVEVIEKAEFEFNRYTDCRLPPQNALRISPKIETDQQILENFKRILGEKVHGKVLETAQPRIMLASDKLSMSRSCNFYIELPMRSTQQILNEIYDNSRRRLFPKDGRYSKIVSKLDTTLIELPLMFPTKALGKM